MKACCTLEAPASKYLFNGWKLELPDTPEAPASKYLLMAGSRSFQVHQNSSFQIFINDWKLELPGTPKLQLPNIY
jgi:nitrogen fixation protein